MIEVKKVSKYYGSKAVLEDVDLFIGKEDRIGIIGLNGAGKTTLFRIIMDKESPDEGLVTRPKHLEIGYLAQEVYIKADPDVTVVEECMSDVRGIGALIKEKEDLQARLMHAREDESMALATRLGEVEDLLVHAEYQSIEAQSRTVLDGLGFEPGDADRPVSVLSGGYLMRLQIAKLLLARPDLMLLDEPTNHLDLESLIFLENYIKNYKGAFCVATHDRAFLNRAVSKIWEIERGRITVYAGGFDSYKTLKEEAQRHQLKQYEEQQTLIRNAQEFITRNRVRKDKARLIQSRKRFLENMDIIEKPLIQKAVNIRFPQPPKGPDKVTVLHGITKAFGEKRVLQGVDLTISRGERIVLVGRNGAGKTTLLRIIAGVMHEDDGNIKPGTGVEVGYYAQDQLEVMNPQSTPFREVLDLADPDTVPRIRGLLGAFRFSSEDIDKKIMVLSGGEKARVALCRLLIRRPGLLVMDEPTNHLDIPSMEVLENALLNFTGTVIMVSHDRRFIDSVATRVVEVDFGRLQSYLGNYSYYLGKKKVFKKNVRRANRPKKGVVRQPDKREMRKRDARLRNQRYKVMEPLRQRVNALESRIEKVESRIEELNFKLADPSLYGDPQKAVEASLQHKELTGLQEDLMLAWEKAHRKLQQAMEEFGKES